MWLENRGGWAVLKGSWPTLVAVAAGEMRKGWEGRDQRERCAARERSGPLDSPPPGATNGSGGEAPN